MEKVSRTFSFSSANKDLDGRPIERRYQDTVFRDLFKRKKYFLQLYKTLHPDTVFTEDDLKWMAMENVITTGLFNDVAYLVGNTLMVFMEHQSTIDNKMPLRFLLYYADSLMRYLKEKEISLHSKIKVMLPSVEFYLVYSGDKKLNVKELRLSDSFVVPTESIEVTVKVINKGDYVGSVANNYLIFVYKVKELIKKYGNSAGGRRKAVINAIDYCISNNILKEYLSERKEEVTYMFIEEITQEQYNDILREEGREEGREEAITAVIMNMYHNNFTLQQISFILKLSEKYVKEVLDHNE